MSLHAIKGKDGTVGSSFDPLGDAPAAGNDPMSEEFIIAAYKRLRDSQKSKRQKMARDWFRAELFYNGIQWVTFDSNLKRWRESALRKTTPKPVTNVYGAYADVFASLLSAIPLEVTYRPTNDAAQFTQSVVNTVNDMVDAIQQMTQFDDQRRRAAPMAARQGEFFICPSLVDGDEPTGLSASAPEEAPEALPGGILPDALPRDEGHSSLGLLAGATGAAQAAQPPMSEDSSMGGLLSPAIFQDAQQYATGQAPSDPMNQAGSEKKLHLDVFPSFECYLDEEAEGEGDSLWFIHERAYDVARLKKLFPDLAEEIHPAQRVSGDISRYYAGAYSKLTSGEFGAGGFFSGSADGAPKRRANVGRIWVDPCPNYPKGLYAVIINDDILASAGPLPYSDPTTKLPFRNIVQFRTKRRIGSVHGRSPMDDVISKQIQRNRLESFVELIIYRMAAPHWLKPDGCGIDEITGDPGTTYTYNKVLAGQNIVLKPEQVPGIPPSGAVLKWLEMLDNDIEMIIGITKVLIGQLPPGTPAAKALEILLDRARARHGDVFFEWNTRWAEAMDMMLKMVRQAKPARLFKSAKRPYGGYDIRTFTDPDFDQELMIAAETEQPAPARSTAAEFSILNELTQAGLFKAPLPIQYAIAKKFGMEYLIASIDSDKEYIARENFDFIRQGTVPIVQTFDNHPMHFEDHRIFAQSEEFLLLKQGNPQQAQEFLDHISAHQNAMAEQEAQKDKPPPPKLNLALAGKTTTQEIERIAGIPPGPQGAAPDAPQPAQGGQGKPLPTMGHP